MDTAEQKLLNFIAAVIVIGIVLIEFAAVAVLLAVLFGE
jgi:hypothetical protein